MRTSKDEYKMPNGDFIWVSQNEKPPTGSKLWHGYDYKNQYWVFEGKKDTRTIEQLRKSIRD